MPPAGSAVTLAAGLVGLVVLVAASRVAVGKAVAVARAAGIAEEVVAVSVIAVGTSLPEIAAHLTASAGILSGTLDPTVAAATALGGNMGSSTTQQLLLVGVFLLGYGRVEPSRELVRTTYLPMLLAFALALAVAADGTLTRLDGLLLVGSYLAYLYYTYDRRPRTTMLAEEGAPHRPGTPLSGWSRSWPCLRAPTSCWRPSRSPSQPPRSTVPWSAS